MITKWDHSGKILTTLLPGVGESEGAILADHKLDRFWNFLEEKFKLGTNKILSIMELWSKQSKQNSLPLNEWLIKGYNMVELCEYLTEAKDRNI